MELELNKLGAAAFEAIPEAVWGAVVGALSVLIATALQARHERRLRREEREMTLRRDVFLRAHDAAARLPGFFGQVARAYESAETLADLQTAMQQFDGLGAAASAVVLVGDLKTVDAFSGLERTFQEELIAVTDEGLALFEPKGKVRSLDAAVQSLQREADQLFAAWQAVSPAQRAAYEHRSQTVERELVVRRDELARAYLELGDGKRKLILRAMEASQAVSVQLGHAVVEVRREMAIPIDAQRLGELISTRSAEGSASMKTWLDRMRERAVGDDEGAAPGEAGGEPQAWQG